MKTLNITLSLSLINLKQYSFPSDLHPVLCILEAVNTIDAFTCFKVYQMLTMILPSDSASFNEVKLLQLTYIFVVFGNVEGVILA